jgi:DNA-binding response OmpR family regulator
MKNRILFVDDDVSLQSSVPLFLKNEGFEVTSAKNLREAKKFGVDFDIVILDWMLPDGQGIDFLKELRQTGITIPVILLTARAEVLDKVLGLEIGAGDYVTKPFEPRELVARIRSQLRSATGRSTPKKPTSDRITVGEIEIRANSREVIFRGKAVSLTKMEYGLLKLLCENPNRVFSREELLNQVWGFENFPTTRTIDTHILQLRQAFGEELFETVRGVGYRLKI